MAPLASRSFITHASLAARILALSVGLSPVATKAMDAIEPMQLVGGWDMSLNDTNRRCRLMLRSDNADQGLMLGMQAGCRRALPILSTVDAWRVDKGRAVDFTDRDGAVVLEFAAQSQERLVARGPEGETYELATSMEQSARPVIAAIDENDMTAATRPRAAPGFTEQLAQAGPAPGGGFRPLGSGAPVGGSSATAPAQLQRGQAPRAPTAAATTTTTTAAVQAAPTGPVRTSDLVGRYIVLRDNTKDTGCMLTLEDRARGPRGTFRAILAPACRDQGIVIFDPLGWTIDRNRLSLTARKGHSALFERAPDGTWQKDPKEGGKPLGFKKM